MIGALVIPLFLLAADTTVTDNGLALQVEIRPLADAGAPLRAGDDAQVTVRVRDGAGTPLKGLGINGWLVAHRNGAPQLDHRQCVARVATFTAGSLFVQPAVDLNVYHVVTLNADPTLTVVDPRFGFGGTHLLAIVELPSPGEDWTLDQSGEALLVAMPASGKVAVVDTRTWRLAQTIEVGANVARIERQPDGGYFWAAYDNGVAAIDPKQRRVVKRIPTGAGPHDLALSDDSRFVFVTNAAANTTSVIDVQTLREKHRIATGIRPVSVAWSPLAHAAFVVSQGDGALVAIDSDHAAPRARTAADPGLSSIRFAPGGRLGFVTNPDKNVVHIVDATTAAIVQTADVEKGPFEVTFSDTIAYIRHLGSETVDMITLANVGQAGKPVPVGDFPGGQRPFGAASLPTPAPGIVAAPGGDGILITNPGDGEVYFYMEGMAAPMGRFSAYSHTPRAAMVIDRSLREVKPAVYSTLAKMPKPGTYDVALFVDSPRVIACTQVVVAGAK